MQRRLSLLSCLLIASAFSDASGQGSCLAASAVSNEVRATIVSMVTSIGAAAESGRTAIHLMATSADSVVLVATDSLCRSAAAARAARHTGGTKPQTYPLWLFKVGGSRYVAFDVNYRTGEYHVMDILDASLAVLSTTTM